jgi:hypothetical protein
MRRRVVPSRDVVAQWRVVTGFWREKAGAGRVPSLISACAAGRMFRGGDFARYPRGVRARSERPPIPTRLRRPFPSFLHYRRGRAASPDPPPHPRSNDGMGPKLGAANFPCMMVCLLVSARSENLALALSDVAEAVETCKGEGCNTPYTAADLSHAPEWKAGRI